MTEIAKDTHISAARNGIGAELGHVEGLVEQAVGLAGNRIGYPDVTVIPVFELDDLLHDVAMEEPATVPPISLFDRVLGVHQAVIGYGRSGIALGHIPAGGDTVGAGGENSQGFLIPVAGEIGFLLEGTYPVGDFTHHLGFSDGRNPQQGLGK